MRSILLVFAIISLQLSFGQTFELDTKNARVEFDYVSEKTTGTLGKVEAKLKINPSNLKASTVTGSVDVQSLETGNNMRDKHLKSKDFFDADKYPTLFFASESIKKSEEGYVATGSLTIKDKTESVNFKVKEENNTLKFSCEIYASDFDVAIKKEREKSKVLVVVIIPLSE